MIIRLNFLVLCLRFWESSFYFFFLSVYYFSVILRFKMMTGCNNKSTRFPYLMVYNSINAKIAYWRVLTQHVHILAGNSTKTQRVAKSRLLSLNYLAMGSFGNRFEWNGGGLCGLPLSCFKRIRYNNSSIHYITQFPCQCSTNLPMLTTWCG